MPNKEVIKEAVMHFISYGKDPTDCWNWYAAWHINYELRRKGICTVADSTMLRYLRELRAEGKLVSFYKHGRLLYRLPVPKWDGPQ